MWFIFNLHTRNILHLYWIHTYYISNIQGMHEHVVWKETLTWNATLCTWLQTPIHAVPLLKANCPIWDPPPLVALPFPLPSSRQHNVYLHTDDINMPNSSSVGHMKELLYCSTPASKGAILPNLYLANRTAILLRSGNKATVPLHAANRSPICSSQVIELPH